MKPEPADSSPANSSAAASAPAAASPAAASPAAGSSPATSASAAFASDASARAFSERRGRLVAGGVLLTVALLALLRDYLPWSWNGRLALAIMGTGFVVWAALARTAGLLVPGGVMIGVGVGSWLQASYGTAAFLWSLAAGFLLIPALSLALFGSRKNSGWAVWPAAGLTFAGVVVAGGTEARAVLGWLREFWPWLVLAGAVTLIVSGLRKNS